jgi:hypothetical protein
MMYMPDAIRATLELMEAPRDGARAWQLQPGRHELHAGRDRRGHPARCLI